MMRHVLSLAGLVLFLFALAMVVGGSSGCKPAAQPDKFPAYCYDRDAFTLAVTGCAEKAVDRAASRACRAEIHKACGITMTVSEGSVAP